MLAFVLAEGTRLNDKTLIRNSIKLTKLDSDVVLISVTGQSSKFLSTYNPLNIKNTKPFLSVKPGFFEVGGQHYFSNVFPIKSGKTVLGTLRIVSSLEPYYRQLQENIYISLFISILLFLFGFSVFYLFSKRITKPLSNLQKSVNKMQEGNFEGTISVKVNNEVGVLAQSFNEMAATIRQLITDLNSKIETTKESEKALSDSETQLKTLINTIPELIWVKDTDGRYNWYNNRFEQFLAIPEKGWIGKTDREMMSLRDYKLYIETDRQVISQKRTITFEQEIYPENQEGPVYLNIVKTPLYNSNGNLIGVLGIGQDITSQKQTEEALRTAEAHFRSLIYTIPDSVWLKNKDGRFLWCNPAFEKMNGLKEEDIMGKTDFELSSPELAEIFTKTDQQVIDTNKTFQFENQSFSARYGKMVMMETIKAPMVNLKGEIVGILGIARDITERKEAEEEIKKRNKVLEKINAEKDKFFSIIAHDLRGPFGNFLGLTELMEEELQDLSRAQLQEMAINMNTAARRLYGLLENLLQWSRSQRDLIQFEPEVFELSVLVKKSIRPLVDLATKKEIRVENSIPENISVFVDLNMMETVIRNLFSNAIKFTHRKGQISIFFTERNTEFVEVAIKDTGIGMDTTLMANLFQLSKQVSKKGTEGEPSTGLGLLLCKEFVEKNGGTIWAESTEGAGSTFYFTIPTKPIQSTPDKK